MSTDLTHYVWTTKVLLDPDRVLTRLAQVADPNDRTITLTAAIMVIKSLTATAQVQFDLFDVLMDHAMNADQIQADREALMRQRLLDTLWPDMVIERTEERL